MVEIKNLTRRSIKKKFIIKTAEKVLRTEKKSGLQLSIAFVGLARMKNLNKRYRGKHGPTDVLAFSDEDLREIVICPAKVEKNAKRWVYSFETELARVLIHGILHLLGYDHEKTAKEARTMREKEDYYLLKNNK